MKFIINLLHSVMFLLILNISVLVGLVNSEQAIVNNNSSSDYNITEDNLLYSYSKVFTVTAILKNVEIFKYHCTINLTLSTVNEMVSCILKQ